MPHPSPPTHTTVQAVVSLKHITAVMPVQHVVEHMWPLVQRFASRDWFTSRTSACGLLPVVYSRLRSAGGGSTSGAAAAGGGKEADEAVALAAEALAQFRKLSADDVPMVRRAASHAFHEMGTALAGGVLRAPPPSTVRDGPTEPLTAPRRGAGATDSKMVEDTGTVIGGAGSRAGAGAGAGAGTGTGATRDGYNVDTGDMSAAAVPPPVPQPITVSAASQHDGALAATTLLPLLTAFARDDQDSVRLLSVDDCVAVAWLADGGVVDVVSDTPAAAAVLAANTDVRTALIDVVETLGHDRAWRVRWSLANRLGELSTALGRALTTSKLLPLYTGLLSDVENEVRTAAAYRIADIGKLVGRDNIMEAVSQLRGRGAPHLHRATRECASCHSQSPPLAQLLPAMSRLSEDASEHVRAALASVILGVAPTLGSRTTIDHLLPLFLRLLKDTSAQVRLNIISKLEAVNEVIGLKVLSESLLPAIQELSSDKQWRVRFAILDFMPLLGRQLGAEFFDGELIGLCVRCLGDTVYAIREAAAVNLQRLAEVFTPAWAEAVIVPRIVEMARAAPDGTPATFQTRMTCLTAAVVRGGVVMDALRRLASL